MPSIPVLVPLTTTRGVSQPTGKALERLRRAVELEVAGGRQCLRPDPEEPWGAARLEAELAPFLAEHERIVFEPRARQAHLTVIKPTGPKQWDVSQVLCDPAGEDDWCLEGRVDLRTGVPDGPLVTPHRITT